ncbi:MAG: NTP transferase domain-containing protein [FCB group bacterium]|nr:NTP transferase domain-containing protein [FCB group bacterium]
MTINSFESHRPLVVAILAAGKGKRMKSDLPKVLHPVGGKPMLLHVIALAGELHPDRIIAIIGHGRDKVIETLGNTNAEYVFQEKQLGTGHAVMQLEPKLKDFDGDLLILSGDVPLLRPETLRQLLRTHRREGAGATLLTAIYPDPSGYGRILRTPTNTLDRIVEHKDCTPAQLLIREINAGIYVFDAQTLFKALKKIDNNNQQGEYYLPDALGYFPESGKSVALQVMEDPQEIAGVNTQEQLLEINRIFESRYV